MVKINTKYWIVIVSSVGQVGRVKNVTYIISKNSKNKI